MKPVSPVIMDYKFIKMEYLDSVSEGDTEIIREILIIFKDQSVEIYNEMILRLSEKNYSQLGFLAHKAKSSVAIMGMDDLALMLKTFELQTKEGKNPELYESYISRFKVETDGAIKELENYVTNL
jgi:HPt (histidine-containing phosphotransfer) domain-containing protein